METNTTSIWETILTVNQFLVGLSRRGLFDFLCWFVIIPRNAHKCRSNRKVERTTYDWLFAGKCGPEINVKKWKYKSCISYFYLSKFEDVLDVAGYFLHQHWISQTLQPSWGWCQVCAPASKLLTCEGHDFFNSNFWVVLGHLSSMKPEPGVDNDEIACVGRN